MSGARVRRWAFVLSLLTLAVPRAAETPAPPAAPPAPLVERATSELVLIEVFATDGSGRPVSDLGIGDLVLHVDGRSKPTPIVSLESFREPPAGVGATTPPGPTADREAAGSGSGGRVSGAEAPDPAPAPPRRFLFFFEDSASEATGMTAARSAAEAFLERGGRSDDFVALAAYDDRRLLRILHEFTTDREALLRALRASIADNARRSNLESVARRGKMSATERAMHARDLAGEDTFRMRHALTTLRTLVDSLAAWPGYKALVFVGEGFPGNPGEDYGLQDASYSLASELSGLTLSAAAAEVAIHTVQTAGLVAPGSGLSMMAAYRRNNSLATLATQTGGLAVVSNDMLGALKKVEAIPRSYYVLGFVPEGAPDGRFHSVSLKTRRKGVSLRYRRGFTRFTPEEARTRALQAAYVAPELHTGLALDLVAVAGPAGPQERIVDLVLYVPPGRVLFMPRPEGPTAVLDIGLVALDGSGRETLRLARQASVRLPAGRAGSEANLALDIVARLRVPLAGQTLTAVVSDVTSGTIGAARSRVEPPAPGSDAVHGLSLYSQDEQSLWIPLDPGSEETVEPSRLATSMGPALRRRFARGERVVCGFRTASARPSGSPVLQLAIERGGEVLRVAPVGLLTGAAAAWNGGGSMGALLPLADLPEGPYLLAVREMRPEGPADLGRIAFRVGP